MEIQNEPKMYNPKWNLKQRVNHDAKIRSIDEIKLF
jgi:hypothetical protein